MSSRALSLPIACLGLAVTFASALGPHQPAPGILLLALIYAVSRRIPERWWRRLAAVLALLAWPVLAMMLLQLPSMPRPQGPFPSPNLLGAAAVLWLFLFGDVPPGLPLPLAAGAPFLCAVLSQSRGALLALGAGFLALLWHRHRYAALAAVAAAIVAVAFIRPGSEEMRTQIWQVALLSAIQRPILGWGTDLPVFNMPLELLVLAGIAGLGCGVWLYVAAWRRADRGQRAFLAAFLVSGLTMFWTPLTLALLFLALGRITASPRSGCSAAPRSA